MLIGGLKKCVFKAFPKGTKLAEKQYQFHKGAQGIKQLLAVLRKMKLQEDQDRRSD